LGLSLWKAPIGILVISIGTRVRSDVDRFCFSPPHIAPQKALHLNVAEDDIRYRTFISILNAESSIASPNATILHQHVRDGIHILTSNFHCTTAGAHDAVFHFDVLANTIFLPFASVLEANAIVSTFYLTVLHKHTPRVVDVATVSISNLDGIEESDAIDNDILAADEMHGPIGTLTHGDVVYFNSIHSNKCQNVRTRVETWVCKRFELIAVLKFCSHEGNAISINRAFTQELYSFRVLSPKPKHSFATILLEGTLGVSTFITNSFPDSTFLE
jgi:hypothetical protein